MFRTNLAACIGTIAVASAAQAGFVNFDDGSPNNTVLNSQYAALGVVFSSPDTFAAYRDMLTLGPGYDTTSFPNTAFAAFNGDVQGTLRMDFAAPASGVSFYAIDVGGSSRDAKAYDSLNNLLETITIHNPGTGPGIGQIDAVVFSASNISYVTFGQGAFFELGDGSLIDDLSFNIPSPASAIAMMGLLLRRRRRRAQLG